MTTVDDDLGFPGHLFDGGDIHIDRIDPHRPGHPHEKVRISQTVAASFLEDGLRRLVGKPVVGDAPAGVLPDRPDDGPHLFLVAPEVLGDPNGEFTDFVVDLEGNLDPGEDVGSNPVVQIRPDLFHRPGALGHRSAAQGSEQKPASGQAKPAR